jgi:zinc-ribbon domain
VFCDACGAQLEEGQKFCRSCGKAVGSPPVARPAAPAPRVAAHIRVLAALWIALGVIRAIPALVMLAFSHWQFPAEVPPDVQSFLHPLLSSIGWIFLLGAVACFVAAWGLLERSSWARLFTIILAAISLVEVPLGTALGIYSLWVLLPESSEAEYRRMVSD